MFGTCSVCKVPTQTRMLEAYSSISNSGKTKEEGKLSFEFDPFDFSCLLFCFAGRSPWATTLQDLFFSLLSHRSLLNFCKLGLIKDGSSLKFIQKTKAFTAALNKGQVLGSVGLVWKSSQLRYGKDPNLFWLTTSREEAIQNARVG